AGADDTPRARMIAFLILHDGLSPAQAAQFFDGGRHHAAPFSEEERKLVECSAGKIMDDSAMPLSVRVECPPDKEERLRVLFADGFEKEMRAMMAPAPLDLRVNTLKAARDAVK